MAIHRQNYSIRKGKFISDTNMKSVLINTFYYKTSSRKPDIFLKHKKQVFVLSFLFLSVLILGLPSKGLTNQHQKNRVFETFQFGLKYVTNTNRNIFHEYWKPGKGAEGFVKTPFYYGTIQAGINFLPYSGKFNTTPNFRTIFYYLQWGKEFDLPFNLKSFNSFRIGSFVMYFDESTIDKKRDEVAESELSFGLSSQLSYPLNKKWNINLSGSYIVVYSCKRIKLFFFSVGISRLFKTPGWIREFLK